MKNWKKLLEEIIATGMSQVEVSRQIGIKPPSVNEILTNENRRTVRWETGDKIIALHARVTQPMKEAA